MSACSASGAKHSDYLQKLPDVDDERARVHVYRSGFSLISHYSSRSASVAIDGTSAGECDFNGFNIFDIPPGSHTITVELWDVPGSCTQAIEAEPGQEYYYEISPRVGGPMLAAGAGLIVAGPLLHGGILTMLGGGSIAFYTESVVAQCGGAFAIESVTPEVAEDEIRDLRYSGPAEIIDHMAER